MKIWLKVPFAEKDAARRAGAKWDLARKLWFIEDPEFLGPFMQWVDPKLKKKHVLTTAEIKFKKEHRKPTVKAMVRQIRQKRQKKRAKQIEADSPINSS